VVQKCINSWTKHNPTYTVTVLSPKNIMDYLDIELDDISFNDSAARESDIVRLLILEKYGGVWSDATVFVTEPYPFSLRSKYEFIGFYLDSFTTNKEYPVLESWFFATVPRGKFIKKWRRAFFKLDDFSSVKEAVKYVKDQGVDIQNINGPEYLFIHVAGQYAMQKNKVTKTMKFMKAEDGPFKYISNNGWKSLEAIEDLCKGNHKTGIIKFRGSERGILTDRKDLQDCILGSS
jgi:Capsular polysaccharide synthesis protein